MYLKNVFIFADRLQYKSQMIKEDFKKFLSSNKTMKIA